MDKPIYAVVDAGVFGARIIAGIIIGIQFTNKKPVYCIGFGKNSVWTSNIAHNKEELLGLLEIPDLDKVAAAGVEVKFIQ